MEARDVLDLLDVLAADGIEPILDGGWGIDALLGAQHRDHDDLDLVVLADDLDPLLATLGSVGFEVIQDLRPARMVVRDRTGRQVDLRPVRLGDEGDLWQVGANPDGTDARYPAGELTTGWVGGRSVRCIGAALQVVQHSGYEPRLRDRHDMDLLQAQFGVSPPFGYR